MLENMVTGKLDQKWEPYYRIVEQTRPVLFVVGRVKRAHANTLKLAEVYDWEGAELKDKKRKITLVEPEM